MANLDLIISVDTSSAHLAGAIGKPVWILNRYDSCWRWLNGREDSPWYPSAKIFQQKKPGDWSEVITIVKSELSSLAAQRLSKSKD
jgi:ADP-heptose:LPS heptosyltransferase